MGWYETLLESGSVTMHTSALSEVAKRLGRASAPETLRARPRRPEGGYSFSDSLGLGALPWHTDGAVSLRPPAFVLLAATKLHSAPVPTELLDPSAKMIQLLKRTYLTCVAPQGRVRRFPAYLPRDGGIGVVRWDPLKCSPNVPKTNQIVGDCRPTDRIEWHQDLLLVLDNRRMLHRRPAITEGTRELERQYVWTD